jgi:outer membrane receptor for ferrienterochelin and colicins
MNKRIYYLILFLFCFTGTFAQNITVLDAIDKIPIPNAHICTESKDKKEIHFWVTDSNGQALNKLLQKSKVAISFLGYNTFIDSILPHKSYTFLLEPSCLEISDIVVTGQYKPETVDKSIYSIQMIKGNGIEAKAATNLGELLKTESNINISNSGVLGTSINMQGLTGEHIKILVDGVPVIGRQNGNIDLSQINLSNIDHVEIIEGPMSVVYGSNALGGVINLITKQNNRPEYAISAKTYYESVGKLDADFSLTKNVNKHFININGGHSRFNGYVPGNIIRYAQNSDIVRNEFDPKRKYFLNAKYAFTSDKFTIKITQELFNELLLNKQAYYYGDTKKINDTTFYNYPLANDEHHFTNRITTKLNTNYRFNQQSQLNFLGAYSYYNKIKHTFQKNLYTQEIKPLPDTNYNDTLWFDNYMAKLFFNYWSSSFGFQGGVDVNSEMGKGKRIANNDRIDEYAAYVSAKYSWADIIQVQPGFRLIYNSKYDAPVVYSMNIKYDPLQKLQFRASYGRGFRSPSLKELYLNFVDANHNVKGNPNLKSEFSHNFSFSANFNQAIGKNQCDLVFKSYHNQIKNKIDFAYDEKNPSKADYINLEGLYKTIGFQLDVKYKLHPRFTLASGVHYYGKSKYFNTQAYNYSTDATASISYHNLKYLFDIFIHLKHHGQQSRFYRDNDDDSQLTEGIAEAYNMLDCNVSRPFFNHKIILSAGAKNLLDVTTIDASGSISTGAHGSGSSGSNSIAWGRTYFIKMSVNISKF